MGISCKMTSLAQQLINGLALGSIYALIALGYTMVYGVLGFINFAHSDVMMLGAFCAYFLAPEVAQAIFGARDGILGWGPPGPAKADMRQSPFLAEGVDQAGRYPSASGRLFHSEHG